MTDRQGEIIQYYREKEDLSLEDIGHKFGVTRQAISQILNVAHWSLMKRAEGEVKNLLKEKFVK